MCYLFDELLTKSSRLFYVFGFFYGFIFIMSNIVKGAAFALPKSTELLPD